MTKDEKSSMQNRFVGLISTLMVALVAFYFGSFATDSQVQALESKQELMEEKHASKKRVVEIEKKIIKIESSVSNVLTGLCIIDKRTCDLKK